MDSELFICSSFNVESKKRGRPKILLSITSHYRTLLPLTPRQNTNATKRITNTNHIRTKNERIVRPITPAFFQISKPSIEDTTFTVSTNSFAADSSSISKGSILSLVSSNFSTTDSTKGFTPVTAFSLMVSITSGMFVGSAKAFFSLRATETEVSERVV
ncbi:hypothetical protein COB52_00905 [Candidatus Kaiserbacteria bacterium]|nr:MAG: hypothetical protein COB52_00905 [Candidatus Kaiserbacteria bacterium]